MKNCVPTLFQASPSFSLHHKLCQSPKTLTKSINMIINHFQSMLCRGVLQTPHQHSHQRPQKHSHKYTLLVSFFYPPSPRFSKFFQDSPSFSKILRAFPRFSEILPLITTSLFQPQFSCKFLFHIPSCAIL